MSTPRSQTHTDATMSDPTTSLIPFDHPPAAAAPPPPASPSSSSLARDYNKGNWTLHETLILITAKRLDDERRARGERPAAAAGGGGQRPAEQRWKWVENYCWRSGCMRSMNQCNDKWDNLLRDYKKVRGYESRAVDPSHRSYWSIERHERKDRNLPTNLAAEVYDALTNVFQLRGSRRGGAAAAPISSLPPPPPPGAQKQETADGGGAHRSPPPPPPPSAHASVSENMSESSEDDDTEEEDGEDDHDRDARRRKWRRMGASVARGASVLAKALLQCEEKRDRRHRDLLEMEERRLRVEAERAEMSRQGVAGIISAVGGLSSAIHALASSSGRQRRSSN